MYKYISLNFFFLFTIPQEIRLKLGFKLRLTDLLIKPIQRLTKYHMLLEAIVKYSQRAGCTEEAEALSKAFHVMTVVPNQANDMMDIGRLQGFEGNIYNPFCERGQKKFVKKQLFFALTCSLFNLAQTLHSLPKLKNKQVLC